MTSGFRFNRSFEGIQLPNSRQSLTFGCKFNKSFEGIQLPSSVQSLTVGCRSNNSFGGHLSAQQPAEFDARLQLQSELRGYSAAQQHAEFEVRLQVSQSFQGTQLPSSIQTLTLARSSTIARMASITVAAASTLNATTADFAQLLVGSTAATGTFNSSSSVTANLEVVSNLRVEARLVRFDPAAPWLTVQGAPTRFSWTTPSASTGCWAPRPACPSCPSRAAAAESRCSVHCWSRSRWGPRTAPWGWWCGMQPRRLLLDANNQAGVAEFKVRAGGNCELNAQFQFISFNTTNGLANLAIEPNIGGSNDGEVIFGYGFVNLSDRALKENVRAIPEEELQDTIFDRIDGGKEQIGFVAQDVQASGKLGATIWTGESSWPSITKSSRSCCGAWSRSCKGESKPWRRSARTRIEPEREECGFGAFWGPKRALPAFVNFDEERQCAVSEALCAKRRACKGWYAKRTTPETIDLDDAFKKMAEQEAIGLLEQLARDFNARDPRKLYQIARPLSTREHSETQPDQARGPRAAIPWCQLCHHVSPCFSQSTAHQHSTSQKF